MATQELDVAHLHPAPAPDGAHHTRHRIGMTTAVERGAGVIDIDAIERGGEAVGVALPADLTVGNDVEPRALLVADGEDSGVVLVWQLVAALPLIDCSAGTCGTYG